MLEADPDYEPPDEETRTVFGVRMRQGRNDASGWTAQLSNVTGADGGLPDSAKRDLTVALVTLKYTQSNSMCLALDGQVIGNGAGQQSRIHCTRLAGSKADTWWLRQHPVTLGLPFREGIGASRARQRRRRLPARRPRAPPRMRSGAPRSPRRPNASPPPSAVRGSIRSPASRWPPTPSSRSATTSIARR